MINADNTEKILNAFRMGVIPDAVLGDMIAGRENEENEFNRLLNMIHQEGLSAVKFVNGAYGTGKTFLLTYLKQMALKQNFVVGSIAISSGFNFSDFSELYTYIMSHLSVGTNQNKKGSSFEDIFEEWIQKLKHRADFEHATKDIYEVISTLNDYNNSFSSVLLSYIRGKINNDYELANLAASWIKGDKNIPYELKRKLNIKGSVDKENAMNMLRSFSKLLSLMGYSGLVITIDEAELIMNNRVDTRKKAYSNIRQIIDDCGSNEIEKCGFIFAVTDELLYSEEKGFKSYTPLFQRIGDSIGGNKQQGADLRQPIMNLAYFSEEDFYEVTKRVINLHEIQFGHKVYSKIDTIHNLTMIECDKINSNNNITIRTYLKKLVEILDLLEAKPDLPIFKTKVSRINR